jgi:hypothetical protein
MKNILLLEEVLEPVMTNRDENFVLFGIRDYAQWEGEMYDMIIHGIQGISQKDIRLTLPLSVPILPYTSEEKFEAWREMSKIYGKDPQFSTFGLRNNDGGLTFFETSEKAVGTEISECNLVLTDEEKLGEYIPDWGRVSNYFQKVRKAIDREFS